MEKLQYILLTKKDIKITVKCIIKVFLYDEPMTKSLKISKKEFRYFANIICEKMAKEKLSYICKNSSNEIIGFCLNEDLVTSPPKGIENVTEKMNPIFNLLMKLDESYLKNKNKKNKTFFHIFMVGVLRKYQNKKIVQKLILKSIRLAESRRFKKILTEATTIKSQNLFIKKFDFNELINLDYKKFIYNKSKIFENIGEKSCKLLELKI